MKRIFFLFTASLLFLACSKDDNNGSENPQELKIKKFTSISVDANGTPNGEMIEYFFDENGKKTKDHIIDAFYDYFWEYAYNDLGQVTRKAHNHLNYPVDFVENYYYDQNDKPWVIFRDWDADGIDMDSISFSYQPQQTNVQWFTPGQQRTEFYYNNADVLISKKHFWDLGVVEDEIITYDNDFNIINVDIASNFNGELNHDYEYDGKINPFYEEFHNYPFNTYYYGYLFDHSLFISPSNATKITRVGTNSSENYVLEITFQYNDSDYPISSETEKDGVLISQATYEYY
ncbi:hypothetical protein [Aequorivita nionensis]|uniref:hypothetical protein n=1 Tax=Aequorivita nionensis TaxID=1287690 RepID=UPI003965ACF7